MLTWILVFVMTLLMDICWANYTTSVALKRPVRASAWSAGIMAFSSLAILQYVANPWTMTASVAGAAVGTFIAMTWKRV